MKNILYYQIKEKLLNISEKWDALSIAPDYAITFAHENINPEPQKGDSPPFSVEYRLAAAGEPFNAVLRSGKNLTHDELAILSTIKKQQTQKDMVVYRGISKELFKDMRRNGKEKNCDLLDEGVLFCSLVKGHEYTSQIYLRLYVPKGSSMIYLGNVNLNQHLYEVVLPEKLPLKIESIDKKYVNCIVKNTF